MKGIRTGALSAVLLAAVGSAAAAETITLECQAEYEITDRLTGRMTERGSKGTWEFVISNTPGQESVLLRGSSIFTIFGLRTGGFVDGPAREVQATDNEFSFCLLAEGCGRNIPNDFGGHTKVLRSVLDRRQSRFGVTVEEFLPDLQEFQVTRYFGSCAPKAPPPERQF
jgi:hypothetical protein